LLAIKEQADHPRLGDGILPADVNARPFESGQEWRDVSSDLVARFHLIVGQALPLLGTAVPASFLVETVQIQLCVGFVFAATDRPVGCWSNVPTPPDTLGCPGLEPRPGEAVVVGRPAIFRAQMATRDQLLSTIRAGLDITAEVMQLANSDVALGASFPEQGVLVLLDTKIFRHWGLPFEIVVNQIGRTAG
jgi:hypothetical protein